MNEKKVEPGMETDAILTLLKLSVPPRRQQQEGVSISEVVKVVRKTKETVRKELLARKDVLPVQMIGENGRLIIIFMAIEDAKNKYPDWIIKD